MSILDEIIANKRIEVEGLKKQFDIDFFKSEIERIKPAKDFAGAIKTPISLIAEIKKASPSAGVIKKEFDPIDIARVYENSGANAISVLTDKKYFSGSINHLREVSAYVDIPVLRKDFIIDEIQIYESRANGADAILLIAQILSPKELNDFCDLANSLGMAQIVEVHDEEDLFKALKIMPKIIGINNRDLKTFNVDINTTIRLNSIIPSDEKPIIVSESGIKTKSDVENLRNSEVNAVLIGEELMRSENISKKIMELFGDKS